MLDAYESMPDFQEHGKKKNPSRRVRSRQPSHDNSSQRRLYPFAQENVSIASSNRQQSLPRSCLASSVQPGPQSLRSAKRELIQSSQSHFFNSLFPSRANRFGYPVYPERDFGIPSPSGPVSFAGFSPSMMSASSSMIDNRSTLTSIHDASGHSRKDKPANKLYFFKKIFF